MIQQAAFDEEEVVNHASLTAAVTGGALIVSAILPHGEVDGMKLCPIFHLTGHECSFAVSRGHSAGYCSFVVHLSSLIWIFEGETAFSCN